MLLSELSSRFINLSPAEVDREIEDALRRVCELLGIDLSVLWQWSGASPDVIRATHSYFSLGALPPPEPMSDEHYPWYRQELLAGRVVAVSSLEELPAEAAVDREYGRLLGIKSSLCLPLAVGGERPVGALVFNTVSAERDWPDSLVKRLQLVGQVFTNALVRRRHELTQQEGEQRLALAADSAGAGLWTLDFSTGVFWATEKGRTIFGYSPGEIITMESFEALVHPGDWDLVRRAIERSASSGEPIDVEYRIIHSSNGRVRWVVSRGRPQFTFTGGLERLMGVSIDISERKLAEEAFRTNEARLDAGAELAGLGFYEVNFGDGVMHVDERARGLCGIPPDRGDGTQALEFWAEHLHPDDLQRVLHMREQLHSGPQDRVSLEYRFLHPTRGEMWLQHLAGVAARDATGRAVATYGVLRDITERKQVEDDLRDLSRRLIRAHEEDRALLARELHDDLTQRLAVLAIEVGGAEVAAPDEPQVLSMRSIREGLVRLSEDVHSLAYQLHPSVLDELGLAEALRTECERRGRNSRLDLSVELDSRPPGVGKDAALCLFRVAQEALSNVTRHAGARVASVALKPMDGGFLLAIRDDGVGFDPTSQGSGRSLGLVSMRERVRLVNGTLDIESAPGQGTTILAWVPAEGELR